MRKIFLACPYSNSDPAIVYVRFLQCNEVAATIVRSGHAVFSQVSMSHPINEALGEESAVVGKLWAPIDAVFMEMMDELIVLDVPGWDQSSGIKREIEFFGSRGRAVSLWSDVHRDFEERA
ncbi:DUF1937 family protein [Nocardia sp. SYP-A9097]|uniref:DUF1937 family protein n=1 Tax=Nocardia sp. SYP-A9097 TaxID=2663237 RepID=UPI00129BE2B2|nr:DUF1937 family protein [Nocardia sp. SYP-A9097]MRH91273.1 DUF1937 family protein [Nocardia sp. SYP-A9097]